MTLNEKIADKFWPKLTYPLALTDALSTLSKQQLTDIRMQFEISNLSMLNKKDLAEKLAEKLPEHLWMTTRCWDQSRMKLVQKIAKNGGLWDKPLLEIQQYAYFQERGILFPGTVDGNRVVIMPSELVNLFKAGDLFQDHSIVTRNTEWIRLANGLLFYYGVLTFQEIEDHVIAHADNKLAPFDMMNIMFEASDYYENIEIDESELIYDSRAINPITLMIERSRRNDLDFYPFTKQELSKAGQPLFVEQNSQFMNFVRYVMQHYEVDREEAGFIVEDCVDATKNGDSLAEILEQTQETIEIPSMEALSAFTNLLVPLMNSTKQWAIKGYSPEELSAKRASAGMLLNTMPGRTVQADILDFQTKQKIGRNDPCPCGSGKKFKKCCGQ